MHRTLKYLASVATCCVALLPACSGDTQPPPGGQAGTSGAAAGGSGAQAGASSGGGGTASGGTSSAGSATGGSATGGGGSPSGGSSITGGGGSGAAAGNAGTAGQTPNGDVVEECLDAPVLDDTRTEALSFQGQGLRLGIVRRADPDSLGTSGTTPWLAQRFALERGATAQCVSDTGVLDYVGSRHNFDDTMSATHGAETWVFRQTREDYDMPTHWTVEARTGSSVTWGPVALTLLSCQRVDTDASCADFYD